MKRFLFLLSLCLAAGMPATAQFSIGDIMSAPFPSGLVAAPAADRLAWVQNAEGVRNVWVAEGPGFIGRPRTNYSEDDGQDLGSLTFSADGTRLIYVRGGGPNRQGEIPNPTSGAGGARQELWVLSQAGIAPRCLGEGNNPALSPDGQTLAFLRKGQVWRIDLGSDTSRATQWFGIRGSAGSLIWSPEGDRLAFVSNRGDHAFIGIYHLSDKRIQYLSPSVDTDSNPVWSPDGKRVAFLRQAREGEVLPFIPQRAGLGWSVIVAEVATGQSQAVWTSPPGPGSVFRFISADRQLFWAGDHLVFPYEGNGWTHLWAVPASGGEARCLTPGDFEVQYVSQAPDGRTMLYSGNQDDIDRQHLWQVSVDGGAPRRISPAKGIQWAPVMTKSGRLACLASGGAQPAFAARLDGGRLLPMDPESLPGRFPQDQLVEPEQVVFSAADGMLIHGQLFKPRDLRPGERRPAVLFFHGGSRRQMLLGFHHRGYYHNTYAMNQYLASRGYLVLSVNYRSGIGYGMAFREALNYGANGASEFHDVLGAGLYLRSRNDVDPGRIGLWGGSYGGYLTALGLARASDLFAAGVDLHGVHDWNVVIRNFVPGYQAEKRAEVARLAFESSPMAHMEGWRSPVLLIHGDDDRNVPFSESVDLAEALRRQGVDFEQLVFPDEVHGFLLHRNWLAAFRATADFFDRRLKNRR